MGGFIKEIIILRKGHKLLNYAVNLPITSIVDVKHICLMSVGDEREENHFYRAI